MNEKEKTLSQDEMIKNLIRDYPVDALEFFKPEIIEHYGKPVKINFHIQEIKKHSHYGKNLKNDLAVIYEFNNGKNVVLTLIEHWSDKNRFDIHRFAHYLIDLDYQFPDYEKLPIALFTDSAKEWHIMPQQKIEIKCLNEVFLTFTYQLVRMKSYEAEQYRKTKNKFIAVLSSAMKWKLQEKILLAIDLIANYINIEEKKSISGKNIEIFEYFFEIDSREKIIIEEILEKRRDTGMIVQDFIKKGKMKGLQEGLIKGKIEGKREGKKEGEIQGKLKTARKMFEKGYSIEEIMDITELSREELMKGGIV